MPSGEYGRPFLGSCAEGCALSAGQTSEMLAAGFLPVFVFGSELKRVPVIAINQA
jgi:hypothetical protein